MITINYERARDDALVLIIFTSKLNKGEFRPISAFVYIFALSQSEYVKGIHDMKLHGVTQKLFCHWIFFFMKLRCVVLQRFLLKFLVGIFYLLRYCRDIGVQTLPCPNFKTTTRICSLRTDFVSQSSFKWNFERSHFLKILLHSYFHVNLSLSCITSKQDAFETGQVDMTICCSTAW